MNCNFQLCVLELFHLKSTVKENKEHTHESLNLPVNRTPRLSNNKKIRVLKAHFPRDKFDPQSHVPYNAAWPYFEGVTKIAGKGW